VGWQAGPVDERHRLPTSARPPSSLFSIFFIFSFRYISPFGPSHSLIDMSASPDPDLRDVFKLLYADDDDADWAMSDEEDEVSHQTPLT